MNTFILSLDLDKRPCQSVVRVRRGDKGGSTISADVKDHGASMSQSGYAAYMVLGYPDGSGYYRKAATYGAGTITHTMDESDIPTGVSCTAYFELVDGESRYSTSSFTVIVEAGHE